MRIARKTLTEDGAVELYRKRTGRMPCVFWRRRLRLAFMEVKGGTVRIGTANELFDAVILFAKVVHKDRFPHAHHVGPKCMRLCIKSAVGKFLELFGIDVYEQKFYTRFYAVRHTFTRKHLMKVCRAVCHG